MKVSDITMARVTVRDLDHESGTQCPIVARALMVACGPSPTPEQTARMIDYVQRVLCARWLDALALLGTHQIEPEALGELLVSFFTDAQPPECFARVPQEIIDRLRETATSL